jgi:putative PIN family toxin of toxin-antitoxin system
MKVFLDTNVWLSATIFSGLCEELVLQCAERGGLYSSLLIQLEAHEVLKRKFPETLNACDLFDASFQAAQLIADCDEPPDDNDRRLVAAAVASEMDFFVTGDKRVLSWAGKQDVCGNLKIVSPRQAWTALL